MGLPVLHALGAFEKQNEEKETSMKPITNGEHCSSECPYLAKWNHPFFHHTAWCWRNLVDLDWYDYWQAACLSGNATAEMEAVRNDGRTRRCHSGTMENLFTST